jgi:hypothetical protein
VEGPKLAIRSWVLILLPFLILAWVLPALLDAGFGWDDRQLLFENHSIRDLAIPRIWSEAFWGFRGHDGMYRPITAMSLGIDHALFGAEPLGYHRVNLLLHTGACLMFAFGLAGWRRAWALPIFLVLILHPAAGEQAMWIAGRGGSLMMLFCGLALLAARQGAHVLSLALVFLAGLCRDDGLVFLLLIPLVVPQSRPAHVKRALLVFASWLVLRYLVLGGSALPLDPATSRGLLDRLGDAVATFGFHAQVLLLFERPRLMQETWPELGIASLAFPLYLCWLAWCWRKGWRESLRAGAALLVAFLPFSGLLRLGEPLGGRYAYALLPWLTMTVLLVPAVRRCRPLWFVPTALLLIPFWYREVQVLATAEATYLRALEYAPTSRRVKLNLALEWERRGRHDQALDAFEELMRLHPRYSKPAVNRGRLLYLTGERTRGLAALERTTRKHPKSARAWLTYGRLLHREKRFLEAAKALEQCVNVRSSEVQAWLYLCRSYLELGDSRGARRALIGLEKSAPRHPELDRLRLQVSR